MVYLFVFKIIKAKNSLMIYNLTQRTEQSQLKDFFFSLHVQHKNYAGCVRTREPTQFIHAYIL